MLWQGRRGHLQNTCFDKVIKGTEQSIEISMSSGAFNFTIEATLSE
jgi:hypothetical protein